MSEVKTNKISSLASNNNFVIDPDGTGLFLPNRTPTFFAQLSADQTINDATETVIQFDNEDFDIGGIWDNSNYRLTVDANTLGYYFICCYLFTSGSDAIQDTYIRLRKNGGTYIENSNAANAQNGAASGIAASVWFSTVIPLTSSGDYADVTVVADRSSSGTTVINQVSQTRTRTHISGFRMGGA